MRLLPVARPMLCARYGSLVFQVRTRVPRLQRDLASLSCSKQRTIFYSCNSRNINTLHTELRLFTIVTISPIGKTVNC